MDTVSDVKLIVFTKREHLKNSLWQACKSATWISERFNFSKPQPLITELAKCEQAIIVIDWDVGVGPCNEVLCAVRSQPSSMLWAIWIIAAESTREIVATCTEFQIDRLRTGTLTPQMLVEDMDELKKFYFEQGDISKSLSTISTARLNDDFSRASEVLENLRIKYPENLRIRNELAATYMEDNKWEKAFTILKGSISENVNDAFSLHLMSKVLLKLGKTDEAMTALKRARLINPTNTERLLELGDLLFEKQDFKGANKAFGEVLALDPDSKSGIAGTASCKLIDGDINDALALMKGSLSSGELGSVFNTAAVMQIKMNQLNGAMDLYAHAIKALRGSSSRLISRVYYNQGIALYKSAKTEEALEIFKKASDLDPGFDSAHHNYKILKKRLGAKKKASGQSAPLEESLEDLELNLEDLNVSEEV